MKTNNPENPLLVSVNDNGFETVRSVGPVPDNNFLPHSLPPQTLSGYRRVVSSEIKGAPGLHASGTDPDNLTVPTLTASQLKAKAVAFLARREHSQLELTRKLQALQPDPHILDQVLNELVRDGWQSDTRFAAALVNRRAARKGAAAIVHELKSHGLNAGAIAEIRQELRQTEADRARAVYQRKFTEPPATLRDYARQSRFLASRGFSPDVIRQILGSVPHASSGR